MRFAIFTHVVHFQDGNNYYGYAPYIREMNLWLQHVEKVEVVAPLKCKGMDSPKSLSYRQSNLTFTAISSFDLLKLHSILLAVLTIPTIFFRIAGAMQRADHLHLRCPGNIGLLAAICQIFFPNKPKTAKYAGNWNPEAKQPLTYKLQKWILSNTFLTRNMTVLVYGNWPEQSKNILPFSTASFKETEKEEVIKDFNSPYKILFVGSLVKGKQPLFAMQLVEALNKKSISAELHIYGEGPLKNDLEKEAENKDYIHLHGNKALEVLKQAYKDAHFLILASKSEGWPKAVAEAMFFGCIPIATTVSCVPWMLGGGSRGVLISEGNVLNENRVESGKRKVDSHSAVEETVERLIELIQDPEEMRKMSLEAQQWSQQYTLEKFEAEIKKLLVPKGVRP